MRKPASLFALILVAVQAHAAITGTIVDPDARPIAGATIRAFAAESSSAMRARLVAGKIEREPIATAQSAENGTFSIDPKGTTAVDVVVEASGRNRTTIPTVDGDDLGAIVLNAPVTRAMHVTSGGKGVANAIVVSGAEVWKTNASGEVPAPSGGAGFVFHPDYAVARRDAANTAEVKLTRGIAVRGRVVNGAGPVPHAIVSINGWPLAESGDDGTFAIAHAPDGWQSIGAVRGNEAGTAARSKAATIEIRLSAAGTFTGTLRDAKRNSAVAGARMTLTAADELSMTVVTDAKGTFTFAPLLPLTYQIAGQHPGFSIDQASVTLPATRTRAFVAQPFAQARGHVIDEDRKPVALATVASPATAGVRGRTALTNAAGEFAVRVVPAAFPVSLAATKRDFVSGTSPQRAWQPGETRDDVVITLAHGFVARVRVIDKQRVPVPNAQVNLMRATTPGGQRSAAVGCADPSKPDCRRTGADGIVSMRTTEGPHDVMVFGDDVAPIRASNQLLTARSPEIVVSVDRGVEISGRVVLADGSPVPDATIDVPTAIMQRRATSAADGSFTIAGIASGTTVLTAHSSDGYLSSQPLTVTAPAKNVTLTMPRGARIEGRVTDRATQQPITDFTIQVPTRPNRSFVDPRRSDGGRPIHADDGHYVLESVPPGTVDLVVRAAGYVLGTRGDVSLEDGKTVTGIDIQLDRGAAVSGRVTSGGAPVSGVQVRQATQRMQSTPTGDAITDADGMYVLDGLAEGDRAIEFQKMGYVPQNKSVAITAGKDVHLDVELDHGRELRGRVVDRSGQGVPGVNLATSNSGQQRPGISATTDGDGAFVIQGLSDGKYHVTARKDGFVSAEANDVEIPQGRPLTLTLDPGATITGHVSGVPPEQLTQVIVTASGGTTRNQTYADPSGNFSMPGLPDGRVRVDAFLTMPGNRRTAPAKNIVIENGVAPAVELNFEEGITVSGRVTKSGTPMTGGTIVFMPFQLRPSGTSPSTDRQPVNANITPEGTYIASGLAAGDYNVRVMGPGTSYQTKYTVVSNSTFDVDIHGAVLRGRVVDASSGAPLSNARVILMSRVPANGSATTDSDGRFVIDALADGTYDMQVSREQYAAVRQQVSVASGGVPDAEVRMEPAAAVTIHITDAATGAPLDGSVVITDSTRAFRGEATRVDVATFKAWLKPGTYSAGAFARGYLTRTQSFTAPGDVTLALERGGSLLIRARSAQSVRLDKPSGGIQRTLGMVRPGPNGPYEALPPGSYLLVTVGLDGKVVSSVPVTIIAGDTVGVDLP
ncbi:MAG: hypothetical protein QOE82_2683 [Thermoanaerobaculia bacterium]|nr:hypothetical protein [Thermoanaerobaculia bacterium]